MSITSSHLKTHEEQVNYIIDNVDVYAIDKYRIFDTHYEVYRTKAIEYYVGELASFGINEVTNVNEKFELTTTEITNRLYKQFYCGMDLSRNKNVFPYKRERDIVINELSKANKSRRILDKNWKVYSVGKGIAFAQKNRRVRPIQPNSYITHSGKTTLEVGDTIDFKGSKESRSKQVVFFHVYGEEYLDRSTDLMRIYWNLEPEGSAILVEKITRIFNAFRVPFSFKCLTHPDLYHRSDSAVLYFDKDDLMIVWRLIQRIIPKVKRYLKDTVPLFTEPIDKGVSIAEDPGNGKSFGNNRCRAIAEALVLSHLNQLKGEARKTFIYDHLKSKGINYQRMAFHPHTKHYLLEYI